MSRSSLDPGSAVEPRPDPRWNQDRELIAKLLAGDANARAAVLERLECVPRMIRSLNRRFDVPLQAGDLDDASQETLVTVWNRLPDFEGRAKFESWVYRFCFLTLMNHMRRHRRRRESERPLAEEALPSLGSESERAWVEAEAVEYGFDQLGPPESDALRLRYFEDLSYRDIADRLGVSPNTAKSYLKRGVDRFRALLNSKGSGKKE